MLCQYRPKVAWRVLIGCSFRSLFVGLVPEKADKGARRAAMLRGQLAFNPLRPELPQDARSEAFGYTALPEIVRLSLLLFQGFDLVL